MVPLRTKWAREAPLMEYHPASYLLARVPQNVSFVFTAVNCNFYKMYVSQCSFPSSLISVLCVMLTKHHRHWPALTVGRHLSDFHRGVTCSLIWWSPHSGALYCHWSVICLQHAFRWLVDYSAGDYLFLILLHWSVLSQIPHFDNFYT